MASQPTTAELAAALAEDGARLGRELEEVELLIGQARQEAARHEGRRASAEQRLAEVQGRSADHDLQEATAALLAATQRTALMESQIDVLEGKQKTLVRMRERIVALAGELAALPAGSAPAAQLEAGAPINADAGAPSGSEQAAPGGAAEEPPPTPSARVVLDAQEDLRRDIARAMHDGPAQSLTNITLQAQIVQRLMKSDPERAEAEVAQLVNMVQQTLEATKTFIFDVRPMVLDDLGLVPTLRRAARDRGRRAQVPIDFDSLGADRRLPPELESAFFRIVDDALVGFLEIDASRVGVRLEWGERDVRAEVRAVPSEEPTPAPVAEPAPPPDLTPRDDLPPAL
ncbi:MAG: sensor histidine kinase, partial [Candidatus Limnocylindrales bacterium]